MVASPNPPEALLDPGTEAASSARAAGSCVLPKRARRDDFTGAHAARAAARRAAHRRQRRRHRLLPASGASGRVLLALPPAFGRLLRCSSSTAGSAGRQPAAHRRAAGHRELPPQLQVGLPRGWHHAGAGGENAARLPAHGCRQPDRLGVRRAHGDADLRAQDGEHAGAVQHPAAGGGAPGVAAGGRLRGWDVGRDDDHLASLEAVSVADLSPLFGWSRRHHATYPTEALVLPAWCVPCCRCVR